MKTIIVLITVLVSFNSFARATDTSDSPSCAVTGVAETNTGLNSILKVGTTLSENETKQIVEKLCDDIFAGRNDGLDMPNWQKTMRDMAGYSGSSKDFPKYFNKFLNDNNQNLICPAFKAGVESYPKQHFYKMLLASGFEEVFDEYFFDFDDGDINYNAYEIVDGKKETIVDWAEKWKLRRNANVADIEDVIEILQDEFGAKRGIDL